MTKEKSKILKVLFVASGNKTGGTVSSFVRSQYESLEAKGLDMYLFPVYGHGWRSYLKAVFLLRKKVKHEQPDIIHAHYSTCGFVASLACIGMRKRPKILVSILGSFPTRNAKWRRVRWAIQHLWDGALTKSERTRGQLGLDLPVIPNGVNLEIFRLEPRATSRDKVGFEANRKYIIWCSNPERVEKNWPLAEAAVKEIKLERISELMSIDLVPVFNKPPEEVCTYMNAADCLLLTSDSEGSPNVIKEAMACNCPIVSTDVGDVRERLHDLKGCYVVEDPADLDAEHLEKTKRVAEAIGKVLEFGKRTEGRKRIIEDKLEISQIAKRIIEVYESL